MTKRLMWIVAVGALLSPAWVQAAEEKAVPAAPAAAATSQPGGDAFKNDKERVSYSIGMRLATGMKAQDVQIDVDVMAKAMKDVLAGNKTLLTEMEAQQVLMAWQGRMKAEMQKKQEEAAAKNKTEGEKYLAENKKKEGVKTTASGLQYKVLKSGTGAAIKETDRVKVNYKGTLTDGTKFDSSYDRGEPVEFLVTGVIPGWTEALKMMKVGDKWEITIPSELAYGSHGKPPTIQPNAVLIFEVEPLEVIAPPAAEGAQSSQPKK